MPLISRLCLLFFLSVLEASAQSAEIPGRPGPPEAADSDAPWAWSADFNAIGQVHPAVDAPLYTQGSSAGTHNGVMSLDAARENSHSLVAGVNLGLRLGEQGEIWLRPETISGLSFSQATGLAAFPNLDMQKFMSVKPTTYVALLFARYRWDLGGDRETLEQDGTRFAAGARHDRFTLLAGKFDMLSQFDDNRWAHKGQDRFLNWCFMTSCAFDFAADARGYTAGVIGEYRGGDWSLRGGRALMPVIPNQLALDSEFFQHYSDTLELERRLPEGAMRLLAFHTHMKLASYDTVAGRPVPIPTPSDGDAANLPNPRVLRDKRGLGVNLDWSPAEGVGLFGRAFWTSANTETAAFTDADDSADLGMVVEGRRWGRAQDNAGIGLAVNAAGGERQRYLAHWLPSLLMGDGQQSVGADYYAAPWFGPTPASVFHYAREWTGEMYYLFALGASPWQLTLDLQRILHPAYNADRPAVTVASLRLHADF